MSRRVKRGWDYVSGGPGTMRDALDSVHTRGVTGSDPVPPTTSKRVRDESGGGHVAATRPELIQPATYRDHRQLAR